jgi:hypothetical protein
MLWIWFGKWLDGKLGRELGIVPGFVFFPKFQLVSAKVNLWARAQLRAQLSTLYPQYISCIEPTSCTQHSAF